MFKQKIKLSLIDDYIQLVQINNFCKSFINTNFKILNLNEELKNCYENLIFKLGLMDSSFLLLKKELSFNKFKNINFETIQICQQNIINGFMIKLKKLKLNEIEIGYLTKNLKQIVKNC